MVHPPFIIIAGIFSLKDESRHGYRKWYIKIHGVSPNRKVEGNLWEIDALLNIVERKSAIEDGNTSESNRGGKLSDRSGGLS